MVTQPVSNAMDQIVKQFLVHLSTLFEYLTSIYLFQSDPYPAVKLGKTKIRDRDNYKAKCLEPMFGL